MEKYLGKIILKSPILVNWPISNIGLALMIEHEAGCGAQ